MTISFERELRADDILFPCLTDWSNLWLAYHKASKGKRGKASVATYEHQLADRLLQLQRELETLSYKPSGYTHFTIHQPKQRKISAAPFRDRVVHHALCNIIEPIFEARFHPHSYANRKGKGTHQAIDQLQTWSRKYKYVLRLDIVKHFPSIDHQILKKQLFQVIKGAKMRWLIETIVASGAGVLSTEYDMVYFQEDDLLAANRPRGLPIGNLTSQFWSNCYLNPFDWFIQRELGCTAYMRYVDDFALFSNSKKILSRWKEQIIKRLATFRLTIHTNQAQLRPVEAGIPWLGFIIYPTHRRLKRRCAINFTRRFKRNMNLYRTGELSFAELDARLQGWVNHVRYANTWYLRQKIFSEHLVKLD